MVFGKNGGDDPGDGPQSRLTESMWMPRDDAGNALVCREMHESDAVTVAPDRG